MVIMELNFLQLKVKEKEKENKILIGFLCWLDVLCVAELAFVPSCSWSISSAGGGVFRLIDRLWSRAEWGVVGVLSWSVAFISSTCTDLSDMTGWAGPVCISRLILVSLSLCLSGMIFLPITFSSWLLRRSFRGGEGVFSGERSWILEKLNEWFSEFFHEKFGGVPSWVVNAGCVFPEFGSSGFMMNTRLEDVLARLGDGRDIKFTWAVTGRLTRDVESFKVGLNVSMSCDRLVESRGDWSAG